jgi:hypothetical protein
MSATSLAPFAALPAYGTNEALYFSLLAAIMGGADRYPDDLAEVKRECHSKAVRAWLCRIPQEQQQKFDSWLSGLSSEGFLSIKRLLTNPNLADDGLLGELGIRVFSPEKAKSRGAVFTPGWLAARLSDSAIREWQKLNAGCRPKLAGDLSCGVGIFIRQLVNKLEGSTSVVGIDSSVEYSTITGLLFRRFANVRITATDTLLSVRPLGQLTLQSTGPDLPPKGYDILVGNPPYIRSQLLPSRYARELKSLYPDLTGGNFDLATLFLAHTLEALAPGGVASIVISSKFMSSKYGAEICRRLGNQARMLEITDFGDGQVFGSRTTYTCTLTFAKLPPLGACRVVTFQPGLRWDQSGSQMRRGESIQVPASQLKSPPWRLNSQSDGEILTLMRRQSNVRLVEVFPQIAQGIRTGANPAFVVPTTIAENLETELLLPYATGEHIRRCKLIGSDHYLIWPYQMNHAGAVVLLPEDELMRKYPRVYSYLSKLRNILAKRQLDSGSAWYAYSRAQNLDLAFRPKLLARELMPRAEFAADSSGTVAMSSGYALLSPARMNVQELRMWAAVLSTSTMEFQLRRCSTQLHSGWFRVLKQHFRDVHLPSFGSDQASVIEIAERLHESPDDKGLWDELDAIVARSFGLSGGNCSRIAEYLRQHHDVSMPRGLFSSLPTPLETETKTVGSNDVATSLPADLRKRYMPVELSQFNRLHSEREDLRQAVTFVSNKNNAVHSWYSFTQGYSREIVVALLEELGVSSDTSVYDPFTGSGTTLLACKEEGVPSFGAEISPLLCWITKQKVSKWNGETLEHDLRRLEQLKPKYLGQRYTSPSTFSSYFQQAYSPAILNQIIGWQKLFTAEAGDATRDFFLLALVSILERVSQLRKHGSHYRFLNKTESVGLAKLNIPVIQQDADITPILYSQLEAMISDVRQSSLTGASAAIFNMDSRLDVPFSSAADFVITSPPYLNRNMYFAQQKAELVLLGFITGVEDYRTLVRKTFRSHVEAELSPVAQSDIPEVQAIVEKVQLSENNNAKIPHMICGYFEDLRNTLSTLRTVLRPGARSAFVVGNCRWGGVVVPVDHLLALLAERLGYTAENIFVTRLKGNSPQQMRRFGRIPLRESVVVLRLPK